MSKFTVDFAAIGGNRHPSAADWDSGGSGLIAYGADNKVAIWDLSNRGTTLRLLPGHTDTVQAVKFLSIRSLALDIGSAAGTITPTTCILSGSVDRSLRVWRPFASSPNGFHEAMCVPSAHDGSVNCIAVSPASSSGNNQSGDDGYSVTPLVVATGAADATVKIWHLTITSSGVTLERIQTLDLSPRFFPLTLALTRLDSHALILAAAGTHSTIHLWTSSPDGSFTPAATLSGHEGWIRSLSFAREGPTAKAGGDLLLASASQDKYIRLWRVHAGSELPAAAARDTAQAAAAGGARHLSNKAHRFATSESQYSVTFEALLLGHEDWIYRAEWFDHRRHRRLGYEATNGDATADGGAGLQLLSASADNSLSIWQADAASGVWVCVSRLGEISAQKGSTSATGSTGGFWAGLWAPDGRKVASLGRTGGWRIWERGEEEGESGGDSSWIQRYGATGHTRDVTSLSWSPDGSYLLSTSADQTTRLWAEWTAGPSSFWHEFARPQIHGYDLNCVRALSPTRFVSGADEKLLRVFDMPRGVAGLLSRCTGFRSADEEGDRGLDSETTQSLPDAADMPVLGLSNKAVEAIDDEDAGNVDGAVITADTPIHGDNTPAPAHKSTLAFAHPPNEDHLSRHTLFPEREKLYGHGHEICALATPHLGAPHSFPPFIATACRASSLEHAAIRLFDTRTWREAKPPLEAHNLTVTALAFAPRGGSVDGPPLLLSVGRDRQWAVFAAPPDPNQRPAAKGRPADAQQHGYELVASDPKGHARMILDCSWAPPPLPLEGPVDGSASGATTERRLFATAGRDKCAKVWELMLPSPSSAALPATYGEGGEGGEWAPPRAQARCVATVRCEAAVTAVAFAPRYVGLRTVLALGSESGAVGVCWAEAGAEGDEAWGREAAVSVRWVEEGVRSGKGIKALAWRPHTEGEEAGMRMQLAVGSEDGSVRIFGVGDLEIEE